VAAWHIEAQVRSVNHKGLNIAVNVSDSLKSREHELENLVRQKVWRGHISLNVRCEAEEEDVGQLVDRQKLKAYIRLVKELAEEEGLPVRADPALLLTVPGVIRDEAAGGRLVHELWESVASLCTKALDALVAMREREGQNLLRQIEALCSSIEESTGRIEAAANQLLGDYHERLKKRVAALLMDSDLDLAEGVLWREVAMYAEKSDVSEEIARMKSHLAQFRQALLSETGPVGRKLEFLGQEMLREANTMAAKMPGAEQIQDLIRVKTDVDRLREQARNVE